MTTPSPSKFRCLRWLPAILLAAASLRADEPGAGREILWRRIEKFFQPPAEFAGKFGSFHSPLKFADGTPVKTPADWARRREEVLATWHHRRTHIPTAEALELELTFLEYWLK